MDGELHFLLKPLVRSRSISLVYMRMDVVSGGHRSIQGLILPTSLICQKKGTVVTAFAFKVLPCVLLGLSAEGHGELIRHSGLNKEDMGGESWRRRRQ